MLPIEFNYYDDEISLNNPLLDSFQYFDYTRPTQTIVEQDGNGFINSQNNNFEFNAFEEHNNSSINNNNINNNSISKTIKTINNLGRKRKGEIRKVLHTKFSDDDIIKRIKTYIMKYFDEK